MANKKISGLDPTALLLGTELFAIVQPVDDPKDNRKITLDQISDYVSGTITGTHSIENYGVPLTDRDTLNFTNGLSAVDTSLIINIKLGGTLIENTTVDVDLFRLDVSSTGGSSLSVIDGIGAIIGGGTGNQFWAKEAGGLEIEVNDDAASAFVVDNRGVGFVAGLEYIDSSYGADFTDATLIHRLYADGRYAPISGGAYWSLASGGTLTGVNTVTVSEGSGLNFNGTWTATANSQANINFGGSITSRNTNGDSIYGYHFNPTINANAGAPTSLSAAGVRIAPTFVGSFTGVRASLEVWASAGSALALTQSGYGTFYFGIGAILAGDTGDLEITGPANFGISFLLNSSRRFTITKDGNVGIGVGGAATTNTRVDIRGGGTTTNTALRIADSSNQEHFLHRDQGDTFIGANVAEDAILFAVRQGAVDTTIANNHFWITRHTTTFNNTSLNLRVSSGGLTINSYASGYGQFLLSDATQSAGYLFSNQSGDTTATGLIQYQTSSVNNYFQPLSGATTRYIVTSAIGLELVIGTFSGNFQGFNYSGVIDVDIAWAGTATIFKASPTLEIATGTSTLIAYDYSPTVTSVVGVSQHIAFRATAGQVLIGNHSLSSYKISVKSDTSDNTTSIYHGINSSSAVYFQVRSDGFSSLGTSINGNFNVTLANQVGIIGTTSTFIWHRADSNGVDLKMWANGVTSTGGYIFRQMNDSYSTLTTPIEITPTTSGGVGFYVSPSAGVRVHVKGIGTTTGFGLLLENSSGTDTFGFQDQGYAFFYVTPQNDDALTQVLVRDGATGEIKYRTAASLGSGGNFIASDLDTTLLADITIDGDAYTYFVNFSNLSSFDVDADILQLVSSSTLQLFSDNGAGLISGFTLSGTGALLKGVGTTTAYSLFIENSSGTDLFGFRDDGKMYHFITPTVASSGHEILLRNNSTGEITKLGIGSGLSISGGNLVASGSGSSAGANNEIQTSDGAGGFVASKLFFDETTGAMSLGDSGLAGATRTITAVGSATDVGIDIIAKGSSPVRIDGQSNGVKIADALDLYEDGTFATTFFQAFQSGGNAFLTFSNHNGKVAAGLVGASNGLLMTLSGGDIISSSGAFRSGDVHIKSGDGTSGSSALSSGHVFIYSGAVLNAGNRGNIALGASSVANWQSMEVGIFIPDAILAPTGNPSNGLFKWVDATEKVAKVRDEDGEIYNETTRDGTISVTFDSSVSAGEYIHVRVPYSGKFVSWDITTSDGASSSIVVDVRKGTYASTFPLGSGVSIAGTEKPTLSSAAKNQDTSLSTWTTAFSEDDYIAFYVDSVSSLTGKVHVTLKVLKNS